MHSTYPEKILKRILQIRVLHTPHHLTSYAFPAIGNTSWVHAEHFCGGGVLGHLMLRGRAARFWQAAAAAAAVASAAAAPAAAAAGVEAEPCDQA